MTTQDFLDVRSHGFVRVAVVVPRVHLADPAKNAAELIERLQEAYDQGAQYALCPELCLTGYSPQDLFFHGTLLASALDALQTLVRRSTGWRGMLVSVGMPIAVGASLQNCAVSFMHGKIYAVAPKSYPPGYREFYEGRWFGRAGEATPRTIRLLGKTVLFGADILLQSSANPDFVVHTEICEDMWVPISPGTKAALAGATILANLSASNVTIGKSEYREQLVAVSSGKCNAAQMYSAAGHGESTTDLAWDGDGYVAERGAILARTERFSMKGSVILTDVDVRTLAEERRRQTSWRQNAADHPAEFQTKVFKDAEGFDRRTSAFLAFARAIDPHPFVPADPAKRDVRCRETFMEQATSLARRLESLPPNLRKIVIGVSGGQDSTHALNVAVYAMDLLGLPRANIICITMPGFGTTSRTYRNAVALIKAVSATFKEVPIRELAARTFLDVEGLDADAFLKEVETIVREGRNDPESRRKKLFFENVQAWCRKHVLFSEAVDRAIVLGTGDLSELALGWCTYAGDHISHYGVNAGVPKTLISYLIRWTAEVVYKAAPEAKRVLLDILDTEISPELLPPDAQGKIAQKTESIVGPYELHDFFLYRFVRFGDAPSKIARMALHAFGGKYDVAAIKKWLRLFIARFFFSQMKRSCLPDGPKIGLTCLSPRGDWRMPSDAKPDAWIHELDTNVPDRIAA